MKFEHQFTVPASPDVSWKALTDVQRVASCMPGAKLVDSSDEEFSAQLRVKVGPVSLAYNGVGRFTEMDQATGRAILSARGKEMKGAGTASATIEMNLAPDGPGTLVQVASDLDITGRPAQFGRGVLQDVGANIIDKFAAELAKSFEAQSESSSTTAPEALTIDVPDSRARPQPQAERDATRSDSGLPSETSTSGSARDEALELGSVIWKPILRRAVPPVAALVVGALAACLVRPPKREVTIRLLLHSDT